MEDIKSPYLTMIDRAFLVTSAMIRTSVIPLQSVKLIDDENVAEYCEYDGDETTDVCDAVDDNRGDEDNDAVDEGFGGMDGKGETSTRKC